MRLCRVGVPGDTGGSPKGKSNGMTRGVRRRNARREHLRGMRPRDGAVTGIDPANEKQALAGFLNKTRSPSTIDGIPHTSGKARMPRMACFPHSRRCR